MTEYMNLAAYILLNTFIIEVLFALVVGLPYLMWREYKDR